MEYSLKKLGSIKSIKLPKRKFIGRLRQNLIITENRNNDICHDCHIF